VEEARRPIFDPQIYPAASTYVVGAQTLTAREVIDGLSDSISPERMARMAAVAADRTRCIVPVLEGLYDRGNVSAVVRSAEGLGYQNVHVIDSSPHFMNARRVSQGAEKWVELHEWQETEPCIAQLRAGGYRIAVAHLDANAVPLREVDPTIPTALVFGNEHAGPSEALLAVADMCIVAPMSGFTQSFNISVAAAIMLHDLRERRIALRGQHGDLSAAEQEELIAAYCLRSSPKAEVWLTRGAGLLDPALGLDAGE